MRWIRFTAQGRTAYGILEGDRVAEVQGDPFAGYERTSRSHALAEVKLEVPVIPRTFYCAGLNYTTHIREMAAKRAVEPDIPKKPDIGYRANNALIAHGEPVVIPRDASEKVQYEGELVCVVGKQAKHLSEADALSCLLGYTIGNDVSERTWQRSDRTLWRAKNTDTFKPMGPWIETEAKLEDMETRVRVNGRETTRFRTNDMLFGVQTFIAAMTRYLTLYPGDVIWMGTDGTSPDLKAGDSVEIEITGVGTLRNPFVAEAGR
jgi:2-keto-4-pentenoate hydratase/2-oxohepta-3-ene-1,7-dioic acid hydratase in catechol pathway